MQHFLTAFLLLSSMLSSVLFTFAFATEPLSNQECAACHKTELQHWQKSDHAKSMALPSKSTVLANFNKTTVEHHGQKAVFYIKDNRYFVDISYDDNTETLAIAYTFGHYPLQQFLVETEVGRLQVLPFAWDSRTLAEGGQRWYHNYANEEIRPEDRLHWRQPLQNWNGMCADCHSDGLKRNFDGETNTFNTEYTDINVGCISCHDAKPHAENIASSQPKKTAGHWQRKSGENTAKWTGDKRDNSFMDNCFSCHSLRSPLTDGITPGGKFLDKFSPQLLQAPMYHADGQIKEEVYVYGSFLQSKMFANGVNCIDCHDQHTMKIKIPGNGLCLQCHASEVFDKPEHHNHPVGSDGAQCVNCHMPDNRYMGVDDRRDHSFKIPRPDLSQKLATPNACTSCHEGKDNQWAVNFMSKWQAKPRTDSQTQQDFWALKTGQSLPVERHLAIVADASIDVISRATALQMLAFSTDQISAPLLKPYLTSDEDLLRLAAASASTLINPGFRAEQLAPLLNDPLKAIRVAAARSLVDIYMPEAHTLSFNKAFTELNYSNELSGWRGEGLLNQGGISMARNDLNATEKAFKKAIKVDPYFDSAYSNLAELYRNQGKNAQVVAVYNSALNKIPNSALLHYGYGLHLVRQQQLANAVAKFKKAMQLDPTNTQYAYVYALSVDGTGDTPQALTILKDNINNYPANQQLVELGLSLAQKNQDKASFDYFMALRTVN